MTKRVSNNLTCADHGRRIVVIPTPKGEAPVAVVHRSKTGKACGSLSVVTYQGLLSTEAFASRHGLA